MPSGLRLIAMAGGLLIAAILAIWIAADIVYHRTTYEVRFVIPNGFRGIITIIEDSSGTSPVYEGFQHGAYVYRYVIPRNGVLRTANIRPMTRWHKVSAFFQNGAPLPVEGFADTSPGDIALRGLTGFGSGDTPGELAAYFIVGTADERRQFWSTFKVWNEITE